MRVVESTLPTHSAPTPPLPDAVLDLLARYEELAAAGTPPTLAELCAGQTELLPRLRAALAELQVFQQRFSSEPDAPPDLPPGYELVDRLGRGGMGVVYRVRQVALGRVVALKMLRSGGAASPEEYTRFQTEVQAAARLRHPQIVQVYEVGEHHGQPYFTLEYCPGGTLAARLAGRPLPPAEAAQTVAGLAAAMQAAHAAQVLHRDLKPANILLTPAENELLPRIADFGLARKLDTSGMTRSGAVMGTPAYMAPEQARGQTVDARADVYALGAILYECLTGRPPFQGSTPQETLRQVLETDPVPPRVLNPAVPRELDTIALKCLDKDPARRYATAQALADDLARHLRGEPIQARPTGVLERLGKWVRRNHRVAVLLGVAALALVGSAAGAGTFAVLESRQATEALDREQDAQRQADSARAAQRLAENARAEVAATGRALKDQRDRMAASIVRNLFAPLGEQQGSFSRGGVSAVEINALRELAAFQQPDIADRFLSEAVRDGPAVARFRARAPYALQAAIGLDAARRARAETLLYERFTLATAAERTDLALILASLGGLAPETAAGVAGVLLDLVASSQREYLPDDLRADLSAVLDLIPEPRLGAVLRPVLGRNVSSGTAAALGRSVAHALTRLAPDAAAALLDEAAPPVLVATLASGQFVLPAPVADRLAVRLLDAVLAPGFVAENLKEAFATLAPSLSPGMATTATERLVTALLTGPEEHGLYTRAALLVTAGQRLAPEPRAAVVARLLAGVQPRGTETRSRTLGTAVAGLCAGLAPEAAAELLLRALGQAHIDYAGRNLTNGLVVAANARPGAAGVDWLLEGFTVLARARGSHGHTDSCDALGRALTRAANWLTPAEAATAAGRVVRLQMEAQPLGFFRGSTEGLAALCDRLPPGVSHLAMAHAGYTLYDVLGRIDPDGSGGPWLVSHGLMAAAPHLLPALRKQVAERLLIVRPRNRDSFGLNAEYLMRALIRVVAYEPPLVAGDYLRRALSLARDRNSIPLLAEALIATADRLPPAQTVEFLDQALATCNLVDGLGPLAAGLARAGERLDPARARQVAARALVRPQQQLAQTSMPDSKKLLAEGIAAAALALDPPHAAEVLLQALPRAVYGDASERLATALARVTTRLEPEAAATALRQGYAGLTRRSNISGVPADGVSELATGVPDLLPRLAPGPRAAFVADLAEQLLAHLDRASVYDGVKLAHALALLLRAADAEQALPLRRRCLDSVLGMLARTAEGRPGDHLDAVRVLLGDVDRTERPRVLAAAALAVGARSPAALLLVRPTARTLDEADLLALLRHPLCVGAARRAVLDYLGQVRQQRLPTQWHLVRGGAPR